AQTPNLERPGARASHDEIATRGIFTGYAKRYAMGAVCALGLGENDVGEALAMQAQHCDVDELVDERAHARAELPLIGDECDEHSDGETCIEHETRAERDHEHILHAEQPAVADAVQNVNLLRAQAGVELLHEQARPSRASLVLALIELDCAGAAHRLQE